MKIILVNQWRDSFDFDLFSVELHNCGNCRAMGIVILGLGIGLNSSDE